MYYEYWGLNRPPFDNVPDPSMYFSAHQTVEQAVGEVLFAIEEGDECLAVIVGEVGLGKTTSLRVILDTIDQDKYRIAFVTNPDVTFTMLLREIIGQLKGETCAIRRKDELLEEFNRILFETVDEDKRVLIFIDEGNAFKPVNLESLRLLTNMQEDDRNLFTIILAGQPKLARMLESPARANLFQRIGVYCRLEKMESWLMVRDYIDHRLERAGRTEPIFTDEAVQAIYRYSDQGVPRLVNKIAKLALKAGETAGQAAVGPEIVNAIGERFKRFTAKKAAKKGADEKPEKKAPKAETKIEEKPERAEPAEEAALEAQQPAETAETLADEIETPEPLEWRRGGAAGGEIWPAANQEAAADSGDYYYNQPAGETTVASARFGSEDSTSDTEMSVPIDQVCLDDVLKPDVLEKARAADKREKMKMAGQLAAEGIKRHPEYVSQTGDPVVAWQELRNEILSAFAEG